MNNREHPFVIGGDFNAILSLEEKYGGSQYISQAHKDFSKWAVDNHLISINTINGIYTWNNRRVGFSYIAENLDRFFIRTNSDNFNHLVNAEILLEARSDHFPIRITITENSKPLRSPFKFEFMWFQNLEFINILED